MEVTEKIIFTIFSAADKKSRLSLSIGDCLKTLSDKYNLQNDDLTEEIKNSIRDSLKNYNRLKKRKYTDKRLPINWEELANYGSNETVIFVCTSKSDSSTGNSKKM